MLLDWEKLCDQPGGRIVNPTCHWCWLDCPLECASQNRTHLPSPFPGILHFYAHRDPVAPWLDDCPPGEHPQEVHQNNAGTYWLALAELSTGRSCRLRRYFLVSRNRETQFHKPSCPTYELEQHLAALPLGVARRVPPTCTQVDTLCNSSTSSCRSAS
eukprot:COSAG02_NODE_5491_length_4285_cov_191.599379_3_plen_158_part_00